MSYYNYIFLPSVVFWFIYFGLGLFLYKINEHCVNKRIKNKYTKKINLSWEMIKVLIINMFVSFLMTNILYFFGFGKETNWKIFPNSTRQFIINEVLIKIFLSVFISDTFFYH